LAARLTAAQQRARKSRRSAPWNLKDDPENESAVEQLTQALARRRESSEAVSHCSKAYQSHFLTATVDLLGDAYTQTKICQAKRLHRQSHGFGSAELTISAPGQDLMSEEKFSEALTVYPKACGSEARRCRHLPAHRRKSIANAPARSRRRKPAEGPPSTPRQSRVMYNEAMLYQAKDAHEDAFAFLIRRPSLE